MAEVRIKYDDGSELVATVSDDDADSLVAENDFKWTDFEWVK